MREKKECCEKCVFRNPFLDGRRTRCKDSNCFCHTSTPKDSEEIIQEGLERLYGAKPNIPFKSLEEASSALFQASVEAVTDENEPNIVTGYIVSYSDAEKILRQVWESGQVAERERILGMIEGMRRKEADNIDVGPINIPDIETQGFNSALDAVLGVIDKSLGKV